MDPSTAVMVPSLGRFAFPAITTRAYAARPLSGVGAAARSRFTVDPTNNRDAIARPPARPSSAGDNVLDNLHTCWRTPEDRTRDRPSSWRSNPLPCSGSPLRGVATILRLVYNVLSRRPPRLSKARRFPSPRLYPTVSLLRGASSSTGRQATGGRSPDQRDDHPVPFVSGR